MRRLVPASWILLGAILTAPLAAGASAVARADAGSPSSASASFSAEAVRAAYLVNFIRFTEWPATAVPRAAPFVIGVAGSRELEDELIQLADKQLVLERRLRIVRVKTPRDLDVCHIVFFDPRIQPGEDPALTAAESIPLIRSRPILTISESPDFLGQGGMVNLYRESGSLRFEIAPEAVRSAGLVLSSHLLARARIFRPSAPPSSSKPAPVPSSPAETAAPPAPSPTQEPAASSADAS